MVSVERQGSAIPPRAERSGSRLRRWLWRVLLPILGIPVLTVLLLFPWDTDRPLSPQEVEQNRSYYAQAYQGQPGGNSAEYEARYLRIAREAARQERIEERLTEFVRRHRLADQPVLDIGSGRGNLQDIAADYTGLDISPAVAPFYHKRFVLGSATAMPFPDNSFAGGWSIWVLEHVPNPEQALQEVRRVMRNGALLFLLPAWNVTEYPANGYSSRPYSDFGPWGKLVKATIPARQSQPFWILEHVPARMLRAAAARWGPTRLHYRRLEANFTTYWEPDSDAVNSIDRHETMLWFRTRGDECLNCDGPNGSPWMPGSELVIRIRK